MFRVCSLAALAGCLLYQGPAQAQDADDDADSAVIKVYVPSDARVFVNGRQVADGDASTVEFETKTLQPGRRYDYEIEAQVMRNGRWVTDRVVVAARAGKLYKVYPDVYPAASAYSYGNGGNSNGYGQGGGYVGGYQGGVGSASGFQGGGPRGNIPGSYALINGQKVFIPAGSHLSNMGGYHGGGGMHGGGFHGGGHKR